MRPRPSPPAAPRGRRPEPAPRPRAVRRRRTAPAASWRHALAAARSGNDLRMRLRSRWLQTLAGRSGCSCSGRPLASGRLLVADLDAFVRHADPRSRRSHPRPARKAAAAARSAGRPGRTLPLGAPRRSLRLVRALADVIAPLASPLRSSQRSSSVTAISFRLPRRTTRTSGAMCSAPEVPRHAQRLARLPDAQRESHRSLSTPNRRLSPPRLRTWHAAARAVHPPARPTPPYSRRRRPVHHPPLLGWGMQTTHTPSPASVPPHGGCVWSDLPPHARSAAESHDRAAPGSAVELVNERHGRTPTRHPMGHSWDTTHRIRPDSSRTQADETARQSQIRLRRTRN